MRRLSMLAAFLSAAASAGDKTPPAVSGCWKVVEAKVPGSSFKVGTSVCFGAADIVVRNDDIDWARMDFTWDPEKPPRYSGQITGSGPVVLDLAGDGRLTLTDSGQTLGVMQRLEGSDVSATLHALPSVQAMRDRWLACSTAFYRALPDSKSFDKVPAPGTIHTTATFRSWLSLAQSEIASHCKPIPRECTGITLNPGEAKRLAVVSENCAKYGRGTAPATDTQASPSPGQIPRGGTDATTENTAILEGTVVDSKTEKPIGGARVTAVDPSHPPRREYLSNGRERLVNSMEAITDDAGRFRIERAIVGSLSVVARSPTHLSDEPLKVGTQSQKTRSVVVRVNEGARIRGVVVDTAGKPVHRAMLLAGFGPGAEPVYSRADGSFEIAGLRPGPYKVSVHTEGGQTQQVDVTAPANDVRVSLEATATVAGHVYDDQGKPASNLNEVALVGDGAKMGRTAIMHMKSVKTDAGGYFRFDAVSDGSYWILAYTREGRTARATVDVAGHASATVDVRFEEGLSLSGVVKDAEGQPVGGVHLWAHKNLVPKNGYVSAGPSTEPGPIIDATKYETVSAQDGTFTIRHLLPRVDYAVMVQSGTDYDLVDQNHLAHAVAPATGVTVAVKRKVGGGAK